MEKDFDGHFIDESLEEEFDILKINISDIIKDRIDVVKNLYESDLTLKIERIKSKYADIQNGSASDMTLGWNRAIDMVLEILEREV